MIVLGPLLMILSGALLMVASDPQWIKIADEDDFEYDHWEEAYHTSMRGRELESELRVSIDSKDGRPVNIVFWIENDWGSEEYRKRGVTPEDYEVDLGFISMYDDFDFYIEIEEGGVGMDDLEVSIKKSDVPNSFYGFCGAASITALVGLALLILGIVLTLYYSNKIKEHDPRFERERMIRQQEREIREEQARKAMEMERIRQRQAMLLRARNLESSNRLAEAAFMYERLDRFEDAARVRQNMASGQPVLNAEMVFNQIQMRGGMVPYLCPRCQGMTDIDGAARRYTRCPYCGAAVDLNRIMSILNKN